MDLSTTYLGLALPHPLVMGASPVGEDVDRAKQVADAGAAAIVMPSLFEEQILLEHAAMRAHIDVHENASAEASHFVAKPSDYEVGPAGYLKQLAKLKRAVDIPVIGSLNGVTSSGWLDYAARIEDAGADALELNVYALPSDPQQTAATLEARTLDMLRTVKQRVRIPVALKLSPFYSSPANFAQQLEDAGADGLVVFNRFYQPDIDAEALEVKHTLELSTPSELLLRLRWVAVLSSQRKLSLAVTGGVHSGLDVLKAVMAGAHAVQAVSAVLEHGPRWFARTLQELRHWLEAHEYSSLAQARGSMNLSRCPDPGAYERANYMRVLGGFSRARLAW